MMSAEPFSTFSHPPFMHNRTSLLAFAVAGLALACGGGDTSSASSQLFLGVGIVVLLPAILGYTWWSYRVFRGKVEAGEGYH